MLISRGFPWEVMVSSYSPEVQASIFLGINVLGANNRDIKGPLPERKVMMKDWECYDVSK
jgi:hypothetical protein